MTWFTARFRAGQRATIAALTFLSMILLTDRASGQLRRFNPFDDTPLVDRWIDPDDDTGTSLAIVVGDVPLVHTGQVLPLDSKGNVVGKGRPTDQVAKVFDNLRALCQWDRLVKINVQATSPEVIEEVKRALPRRLPFKVNPAVSFVLGALPHPDAVVAMDAVSVANPKSLRKPEGCAILPAGPKVYIAGQAEKGDLATATRRTLESLEKTLKFLGLDKGHVVQLRAFLTPMSGAPEVQKEAKRFFAGRPVPPLVLVEWKSSLPIEIELIAWSPRTKEKAANAIDFLTPPGMTASPIYSRVTRINHGKTIYVSGLYGMKGKDATGEVEEIFTTLDGVLKKAGSDLRHLAKATYYVSTDDASRKLNELRPRYYDPKRPPAASKALVPGVGVAGRSVTLDMIAVTRP